MAQCLAVPWRDVVWCALLRCTILSCAVLCCAVLCSDPLRCAVHRCSAPQFSAVLNLGTGGGGGQKKPPGFTQLLWGNPLTQGTANVVRHAKRWCRVPVPVLRRPHQQTSRYDVVVWWTANVSCHGPVNTSVPVRWLCVGARALLFSGPNAGRPTTRRSLASCSVGRGLTDGSRRVIDGGLRVTDGWGGPWQVLNAREDWGRPACPVPTALCGRGRDV